MISFGIGEPDFPTPAHVVQAAAEACADPKNHKYSAAAGLPELRKAIAEKTRRDSGLEVDPSQVLVTVGGKHAIFNAFLTMIDAGDEVIIQAPYWTTYPEAVRLAGGTPVIIDTDEASGFRMTVEQLEAARSDRTKMIVFVSPSNPTGVVYDPAEVEAIGRWAHEQGIWVLTDEIYEHLLYDGARHVSMPVVVPELADSCIVVNGVAKTYAMTGWRVGWMIGPPDVVEAATNLQSHSTSNIANVSQVAALSAIGGDDASVQSMQHAFDRRRRRICELLRDIPGMSFVEPKGAFYVFASVKAFLGRDIRGRQPKTSLEMADLLLEEARIAAVPGEAFGTPGYLRLTYALSDANLDEGIERMAKLLAE